MGSQGLPDSQDPKVTEASLGPQDGQASLERRVLWASQELDFQGLQAPKVWTAYPETWVLQGSQAARDLTAYLAALVHLARRGSLELVFLGSKACLVSLAFLAPLERKAASGDLVFPGSMEQLAPLGFRASEAILDLLEYRDPQAHLGLRDLAPLEPWAPLEDQDYQGHQVLLE